MEKWNTEAVDGIITIPDELDKLVNSVGMQIRFHTISGTSEGECIARIVYNAQKFFSEHPELLFTKP